MHRNCTPTRHRRERWSLVAILLLVLAVPTQAEETAWTLLERGQTALKARMAEGGRAVVQAITVEDGYFDIYRRGSDFIRHYTFPGGMLLALLASRLLGVRSEPGAKFDGRHDVVTRLHFGEEEPMLRFVQAVQTSASPIDAHVLPVSEATDGYHDAVVFAAGTFVEGSTSELTADGPLRPPFVAYCQGGTHVSQWCLALERVVDLTHWKMLVDWRDLV